MHFSIRWKNFFEHTLNLMKCRRIKVGDRMKDLPQIEFEETCSPSIFAILPKFVLFVIILAFN